MFVFEKFPVYLKSEAIYKKLSDILMDKLINTHLRDQLRRALLSITLNIAEGAGKLSSKDKKNFYLNSKRVRKRMYCNNKTAENRKSHF